MISMFRLMLCLFVYSIINLKVAYCQMNFQGENLYGNEWIDFSKEYVKFSISEDNIYRIPYNKLVEIGFPENIKGRELQLYSFGKQVSIFTSTVGTFGPQDYIEFVGYKNRGELDAVLFSEPDSMQLNPSYSMFSDDRPYYLTWDSNSNNNLRIDLLSNDLSGNIPNVEPYYLAKNEIVFSDFHISPVLNKDNIRYSSFYNTEGFGSALRSNFNIEIKASNIASNGPYPKLNYRLGASGGSHILNVKFNNEEILNEVYSAYEVIDKNVDLNISDIDEINNLEIVGKDGQYDNYSIASVTLEYPRFFNAENKSLFQFNISQHSFPKYFEIDNFLSTSNKAILIDAKNNIRLLAETEGGKASFLLPRGDEDRELWLANIFSTIDDFESIKFIDYRQLDPEYIILTSKELAGVDENGQDWILNYKDYRSDSYRTEIVFTVDIIEQFGYGLDNYPQAINNWSQFLKDKWNDWGFVFIVGKTNEYNHLRTNIEDQYNHVPTFGLPGSDQLLFAEIGTPFPKVAVGRLAAREKSDIKNYLEKINTYEDRSIWNQTIEHKAWMKNIIHLSGGKEGLEEGILSNYIDVFADIVDTSLFAGSVSKFKKTSSNPIQSSLSQSIIDQVNNGVSLITFFGHSAVGTFDFSIEDPSKFDNYNKLPMIVSLGCHSGNVHTNSLGISEDFVLYPEKGSICFYAASGSASINAQFYQGSSFYDLFGNEMYGQEIGSIFLAASKENEINSFLSLSLAEQLTLHGDPALKLNPQEGPDYIPDFSSISIEPEIVSTNIDSLTLNFDFVNIGTANFDSLEYYIIHNYGNQFDTLKFVTFSSKFRENISQKIPLFGLNSAGKNAIQIIIDPNNKIPELPNPAAELNNSLNSNNDEEGYCFYVVNDNPTPFYPPEFSIDNKSNLTLKASTGNAFVDTRSYEIRIDTTELFNSPVLLKETISVTGGLIEWTPQMNYTIYSII